MTTQDVVPPRRRRRAAAADPAPATPPAAVPAPPSDLATLGVRLRAARKAQGLSQDTLAAPEYTKSYISAVERGKARPSLKALELLARRLDMSMNALLATPAPALPGPDPATRTAQLKDQLDEAAVLLHTQQPTAAGRLLDAAAAVAATLPDLAGGTRFRLHFLRAQTYLRLANPAAARQELALAEPLAATLEPEAVEQVRNALGAALAAQGQPHLALEHHGRVRAAIDAGTVTDLTLRLALYRNLAADYLALHEDDQAIRTYQAALHLLTPDAALAQQAANYWERSRRQHEAGDLTGAHDSATQALALTEAAQTRATAIQAIVHLAAILGDRGDTAEAQRLLERAQLLLPAAGNDLLASQITAQYAALALRQDHLAEAEQYATESVARAERAQEPQAGPADARARAERVQVYAAALRVAGEVAEHSGQPQQADVRFQHALSLAQEAALPDLTAALEHAYADLLGERGDHAQATQHYRAALRARPQRSGR